MSDQRTRTQVAGRQNGADRPAGGDRGAVPSPFVLDIRSLNRRAGSMSQVHRTVRSDKSVGLDLIAIPADTDVDLDLRLESVQEGVLVTGTVSSETAGQCARCLEPLAGTVTVFLTELFAYPDSVTEQTTDDDEVGRIDDDRIDLEQSVIDAVGLDLPMSPLCRDDCSGLCSECGVRIDNAGPDHGHDVIDPRWAALRDKVSSDADEQGPVG